MKITLHLDQETASAILSKLQILAADAEDAYSYARRSGTKDLSEHEKSLADNRYMYTEFRNAYEEAQRNG